MRISALLLILVAALLVACQSAPASPPAQATAPMPDPVKAIAPGASAPQDINRPTPAPAATGATIRMALLPVTDVLPMYVAEQENYFKDQGLNIQLIPVASAAERDQLMQGGQADGILTDLVNTVIFNAEQPRLKVVRKARQAFPNAAQFRLLVSKESGINTVNDLKGVEIGISDNSVIAYWTDRVLQREGLSKADIKTQAIPNIVQRAQLLGQNQLKAGVLPDPLASLAILQGAKVLVDDTKYVQLGQSVLAFRAPFLQQNVETVQKFLVAYDKAVLELRANPTKYRTLMIEKGRVPDQLKESFPMPQWPDPSITTEAEFKDVADWALEKGIVKAAVSYATSVDGSFVK